MPDLHTPPPRSLLPADLTLEQALLILDERGWVHITRQRTDGIALHYVGAVDPEPHDLTLAPYEVILWATEILTRQQRRPPVQLSLFDR